MWALDRTPSVRVLLIDDDDDDAALIRSQLSRVEDVNYELDWVATYAEGLASIERHEHDAYLVDQQLGGRTGTELVREARGTGSLAALIMMTGQRERATDMAAMSAGATDYLMKGRTDTALLDRTLRYAIAQAGALAAVARSRNQIAGLEELGGLLVDNGPEPEVMARIVDLIVDRFGLPRVAIYLADGDQLELAGQRGHPHALKRLSRADTMVERVARARQPVFVPSFTHDGEQAGAGRGVATELSVPLLVDGELAGLLNVASLIVAPIGEADYAAIRLVGERLAAALSLVHERASAGAKLARARRESATSETLIDGAASVYRHSMLEPLLDVAIAAADAKGTRKPGLLLVGRNDTAADSMDRLELLARAAFADRPLVRGANGELGVLMLGIGVAVARSETHHFVDAAMAVGLDVWCGYTTATGRSTAAELSGAAELALARAQVLVAGTIVG
jgi:CheY-like chemotaxis protein/GAF domain-containing protein